MKIFYSLLIIALSGCLVFPQDYDKPWIKSEQERFQINQRLSKVNYPGDSKYDVKYYKLDLTLTYAPQNLTGTAAIKAVVDTLNVNSVFFDLTSALIVDSVKLNNNTAVYNHSNNLLTVELGGTYNSGYNFETIIYYHGVPSSSGFGSFTFANGRIFTLSEPYGSRDWFPCKDTPADKADSADIWITVANNLKAISNGKLLSIDDNGNGTHTYKWKVSYPIAQYLLSLAIADYVQYDTYYRYAVNDSMPINHFVYPEHFNDNTKAELDKTDDMITVFAQHFGEYPFINEKYGHAEFGWGGGMEHQTVTSLGGYGEGLISHELAHQWYGDAVTCKDWHHIWLNEGFATYAQGVWLEATQGRTAYNDFINQEMVLAKFATGSIWVQDITDIYQIFNGYRSYAKGGVVLHMLRGIVGDSVFYDILRTYTYHPSVAYNSAVTEDFQAIAESVSGMDLSYFFQEWIYGENYPQYDIAWNKSYNINGKWNVNVTINQASNTNPVYFTMPVQIKFITTAGNLPVYTLFNNSQSQSFNLEIDYEPTELLFDPNNLILKTINSITSATDSGYKPDGFVLYQNYPNPFNPTTKISWQSPVSDWQTLKVYDVLGNEVATLVNEYKKAGNYEIEFKTRNLTSGLYFYRLQAGDPSTGSGQSFVETKKMILLK